MVKKTIALVIIPLILIGLAYGAQQLTLYSWDQVVEYQSPYITPLPSGNTGTPLASQVVLVVVDGLRLDTSREMPELNRLRQQGADLSVRTGEPSLSYASWTAIASGAFQEISEVTTNWYEGEVRVDTIFKTAKASGLRTAVIGSNGWGKLFGSSLDIGRYLPPSPEKGITIEDMYRADEWSVTETLKVIKEQSPNLLLVHFDGSDEAGHTYGGASAKYKEVVRRIDSHIARLTESLPLTSTALIVTADHGHLDTGGHGGWEEVVKRVPLVMVGQGIRAGAYPEASQTDIAPTVALLLGTSIPVHSQGEALLSAIDASAEVKGRRGLDNALQLVGFYDAYARALGAKPFAGQVLSTHRAAIAQGEEGALHQFATELRQRAEGARGSRLNWERLGRLPIALVVALVPLVYFWFNRRWRAWVVPVIGTLVYLAVYNGLFFERGYRWSLSVFNSESMIKAFFTARVIDAIIAMVVVSIAVGLISWRRTLYETARGMVDVFFLAGYITLLQVDLFYWLYNVSFPWYIPDLQWGFKYYLDLLQWSWAAPDIKLPTVVLVVILPLLAVGVWWVVQWVGRRRRGQPAPTSPASEAPTLVDQLEVQK